MHAAGRLYRRVHHPASARGPKGGDTELRSSFPSSSPKPSSRLAKPERFSNETCPIQTESDNNLLNHTVDRDCYRAVSASFAGESALIEHLIVEYASLLGTGLDTDDVDMMYEQPRPAPAVPQRHTLNPLEHQSSLPRASATKPDPGSKNLRRLRLKIQHPTHPTRRTQPDQESPDWACRTSLAIEAAMMSMGRGSTPRHIADVMRSPTEITPPDRRRVHSFGPGGKEATYPSPSSNHSLTHLAAGRHSEGALQLVRGTNIARLLEKLQGMETPIRADRSGRDCVLVTSPLNLNKSLPALPLQAREQSGERRKDLGLDRVI